MKKLILYALMVIGAGTTMPTGADAQFYVYDKSGKELYKMEEGTPAYIEFEAPRNANTGFTNGYQWVDMGLSVKWATVNVGASNPQDAGNHYAWGEVYSKNDFSWSTYTVENADLIGPSVTTLESADDAATANLGGDWVMPTMNDWKELIDNTTQKWTTDYNGTGVKGYILFSTVVGYKDVSIFLPAAGYRSRDLYDEGSEGRYWSSSLDKGSSDHAISVSFSSGRFTNSHSAYRIDGQSVRPICSAQGNTNGYGYVNLGLPSGKLWATCNVGANAPQESGSHLAWGETEAKSDYSWSTYKHIQNEHSSDSYMFDGRYINKYWSEDHLYAGVWYKNVKYLEENKSTLEADDDVATQNWGPEWRMPTIDDWKELYNNTTQEWTNDYNSTGVAGCIITSSITGYTDAVIFLPAAGYFDNKKQHNNGSIGFYWSSNLGGDFSQVGRSVNFRSDGFHPSGIAYRLQGLTVRPVCPGMK